MQSRSERGAFAVALKRAHRTTLFVCTLLLAGAYAAVGATPTFAQTPQSACPGWTTITVGQRTAGSSTLNVTMEPPLSTEAARSLYLYYFIDKPVGAYAPDKPATRIRGGDMIPAGSADIVQQVVDSGVATLDLKVPAGDHTVTAVLGLEGEACQDQRPPRDPCDICTFLHFLISGSTEFTVGAQAVTTVLAPETRTVGPPASASSTLAMALLLVVSLLVLVLGSVATARRRR